MLDDLEPQTCTNARLRQFTRLVTCHYELHLRAIGIRNTQLALLSHVIVLGPIRPGDLARRMQMDESTLTRNVQLLVAKGWLVVGEGSDARSRLIHITNAGRTKRAEGQRHWKEAQRALGAKLGAPQLTALHALLDTCTQCLRDADGSAASGSNKSGAHSTQDGLPPQTPPR